MWKSILIGLGTLALMLVCGGVTLFAAIYGLMELEHVRQPCGE